MSSIKIEFSTNNAAFRGPEEEGSPLNTQEVEYVLSMAVERILGGYLFGQLVDSNGNSVGTYEIRED